MVSTGKCQYCGATIKSSDQNCPNCGAPNPNFIADTKRQIFLPRTIEELKEYCAERGMPLLRMRFFIGEDYRQPKAFGIYKDGDEFVVYKNKANGQRAVRYRGTNEEYVVNELFQKLLQECHNRGIYPDEKPVEKPKRSGSINVVKNVVFPIAVTLLGAGFVFGTVAYQHKNDGYYVVNNQEVYYHLGENWYHDSGSDWHEVSDFPYEGYEEYYVGPDYNSDWGGTDFKDSEIWEEYQESHTSSSSDYDSWDSSDTDWDSDW